MRIVADQIGGQRAAVGHRHGDMLGAVDHMSIGENESVGRENQTGAAAATRVDLHHCRSDEIDGASHRRRVRVEQLAVVWLWNHNSMLRIMIEWLDHPNGWRLPQQLRIT